MEDSRKAEVRQTLLNAFENLQARASELKGLVRLSETLNEKLNRTEGQVKVFDEVVKELNNDKQLNLIELFMDLSDQMQRSINDIGNNTERVLQMID